MSGDNEQSGHRESARDDDQEGALVDLPDISANAERDGMHVRRDAPSFPIVEGQHTIGSRSGYTVT